MAQSIIEVENLSKTFQIKQKQSGFFGGIRALWRPNYKTVKAVDNISFSVNEGELVAFIGPNGAGKSTTIKMLTGILFPSSGVINVFGFNPSRQRQKLAYHIGSVFGQKPQLWYHLPPQDTYNLFSRIYELDQRKFRERLDYLVDAFEIADLLKTPVRKMSLGQRMRCEVVASLLHQPKIVFLDEPTIGLDVIAKQRIRQVIKHLNETEKVTIFLTSHDAGDVEALAQRTIVINHGKILFDDTTEQFKKNYIKTKTVELVVDGHLRDFNFPSGKVVEKTNISIKIEIDPTGNRIQDLLKYATENYQIKDINISDPPMEEIIAAIYQGKKL
jgi:ABC-2 type transport system ATP-binding protein